MNSENEIVKALKLARATFEEYAALHREKGTCEGDLKAESNAQLALRMAAALSAVTTFDDWCKTNINTGRLEWSKQGHGKLLSITWAEDPSTWWPLRTWGDVAKDGSLKTHFLRLQRRKFMHMTIWNFTLGALCIHFGYLHRSRQPSKET